MWRRRLTASASDKLMVAASQSHEQAKGGREVKIGQIALAGGSHGPNGSKAYARMERPGTQLVDTRAVDSFAVI